MVGYGLHYFQHMDDEASSKDQILKNLEEITIEAIIGTLHCEMMVMSSFQYIISPLVQDGFLNEDSLFKHEQSGSGLYD